MQGGPGQQVLLALAGCGLSGARPRTMGLPRAGSRSIRGPGDRKLLSVGVPGASAPNRTNWFFTGEETGSRGLYTDFESPPSVDLTHTAPDSA
jgi:hypothetical protein